MIPFSTAVMLAALAWSWSVAPATREPSAEVARLSLDLALSRPPGLSGQSVHESTRNLTLDSAGSTVEETRIDADWLIFVSDSGEIAAHRKGIEFVLLPKSTAEATGVEWIVDEERSQCRRWISDGSDRAELQVHSQLPREELLHSVCQVASFRLQETPLFPSLRDVMDQTATHRHIGEGRVSWLREKSMDGVTVEFSVEVTDDGYLSRFRMRVLPEGISEAGFASGRELEIFWSDAQPDGVRSPTHARFQRWRVDSQREVRNASDLVFRPAETEPRPVIPQLRHGDRVFDARVGVFGTIGENHVIVDGHARLLSVPLSERLVADPIELFRESIWAARIRIPEEMR
jgi:hypothetical protein